MDFDTFFDMIAGIIVAITLFGGISLLLTGLYLMCQSDHYRGNERDRYQKKCNCGMGHTVCIIL